MKKKALKLTSVSFFSALFFVSNIANAKDSCEEVFDNIYKSGLWGINEEGVGFSGAGSTLDNSTPYIEFLEDFLKSNQIETVVDVGCGDWTFSQYVNWGSVKYIGYDVVKSVIEKDNEKFSSENISFVHADILQEDLPPADLLLCKDVLMHLTLEDIHQFLKQLGKYKHCILVHDYSANIRHNGEVSRGGFRAIDLTKAPFNLVGQTMIYKCPRVSAVKQILYIKNQ